MLNISPIQAAEISQKATSFDSTSTIGEETITPTSYNTSILDNLPVASSSFWLNDTDGSGDPRWISIQGLEGESYSINFTDPTGGYIYQPSLYDSTWREVSIISQDGGFESRELVLGNLTGQHYMEIDLTANQNISGRLITYTGQHPQISPINTEDIQILAPGTANVTITKPYLSIQIPVSSQYFVEIIRANSSDLTTFQQVLPDGTPLPYLPKEYTDKNQISHRIITLTKQSELILLDTSLGIGETFEISSGDSSILSKQFVVEYQMAGPLLLNTELKYTIQSEECVKADCTLKTVSQYIRSYTIYQDLPSFSDMNILDTAWESFLLGQGNDIELILPIEGVWSDGTIQLLDNYMTSDPFYKSSFQEESYKAHISMNFEERELTIINQEGLVEEREWQNTNKSKGVYLDGYDQHTINEVFGLYYNISQTTTIYELDIEKDVLELEQSSPITSILIENNLDTDINFIEGFARRILSYHVSIYVNDYLILDANERLKIFNLLTMPTVLRVGNSTFAIQDILKQSNEVYFNPDFQYNEQSVQFENELWYEKHSNSSSNFAEVSYRSDGRLKILTIFLDDLLLVTAISQQTISSDEDTTPIQDSPTDGISTTPTTPSEETNPEIIDSEDALLNMSSWSFLLLTIIAVPVLRKQIK